MRDVLFMRFGGFVRFVGLGSLIACSLVVALHAQAPVTAIVGATVIDGNGGAPMRDAAIVISGTRIAAIGPRASVTIPAGATRIDATGQWIIPGMIDTNVHLSLYGGQNERYETLVRYQPRFDDIVLEAAQIDLSYGITTVRDSYGALVPLTHPKAFCTCSITVACESGTL